MAGADASVVRRTQAALAAAGERPVHFGARFTVGSHWGVAVAAVVGGIMQMLAGSAWGRWALLRCGAEWKREGGAVQERWERRTRTVGRAECVSSTLHLSWSLPC